MQPCDFLTNMAKMKFAMNRKHGRQMEMKLGLGLAIQFGHELTCRTSGYFNTASAGRALALLIFLLCRVVSSGNIMKIEKAKNMRTNCHH